jgi:hypothetical protein
VRLQGAEKGKFSDWRIDLLPRCPIGAALGTAVDLARMTKEQSFSLRPIGQDDLIVRDLFIIGPGSQELRQFGDVGRDASRFIPGHSVGYGGPRSDWRVRSNRLAPVRWHRLP